MRVKELLLEALSRANHIEDGSSADSREISKARKHFRSALTTYSDSNLITAFQKVATFRGAEEQVVGSYNLKKGKVMKEVQTSSELPDVSRLTVGRDYAHVVDSDSWYFVGMVYDSPETGYVKAWMPATSGTTSSERLKGLGCCDYVPDVIVTDMERVSAAMYRTDDDPSWRELNFVPLASFYVDGGDEIYCSVPHGENKVKLFLPPTVAGLEVRLIYMTSMKFNNDDYIELPEVYKELLTLATVVGLLSEDADSDPTQLNRYTAALEKLEHQIGANNANTRRIARKPGQSGMSLLQSGRFISRRFCR